MSSEKKVLKRGGAVNFQAVKTVPMLSRTSLFTLRSKGLRPSTLIKLWSRPSEIAEKKCLLWPIEKTNARGWLRCLRKIGSR